MHEEKQRLLRQIVERFGLSLLRGIVEACDTLAQDRVLDVAVLGQFKSGKSTLLNTILGETLFPVGVLPVTAVITRVSAGTERAVRVAHWNNTVEHVDADKISEFVSESRNPGNRKQVSRVDISIPLDERWSSLRFVDTPGLGSVFAHNTEVTEAWMPHASVALVVVSSERPFSEADRQLVIEARKTAPRVAVVLSKVDLLSEQERSEVTQFIADALREGFGDEIPVIPFSARVDAQRWVDQLRERVIEPVASNATIEWERAFNLKLDTGLDACQGYLQVALAAAERDDADRERLRQAIFTETVGEALIGDELNLAKQRVCKRARPAFETSFSGGASELEQRLLEDLREQAHVWRGNLAVQTDRYRQWLNDSLRNELSLLSRDALPVADELLDDAETRFARILGAFRDRLGQNIQRATGIAVSSVTWLPHRAGLSEMPVAVSHPFMTNWELLSWLLPMSLIGGLFRRHLMGRIPREVEKNLSRLVSEWTAAVDTVIENLESQAIAWVKAELATLNELIQQSPASAPQLRHALEMLAAARR